jgi:AcrR family transcriptional regulator
MPRPKQSEDERAAIRERILDAAREVLMEQGPQALSTRVIAERLGVSHMVLYTYFENTDAMSEALRARLREEREATRAEALRQAEMGDVAAAMRESLRRYASGANEHPAMYTFLWVQPIAPDATCREAPHRPFEGNIRYLTQLARIGMERGVFVGRDPTVAAGTAFGIVQAPLLFYYSGRLNDSQLRDRLSDEALDVAMRYLMGGP